MIFWVWGYPPPMSSPSPSHSASLVAQLQSQQQLLGRYLFDPMILAQIQAQLHQSNNQSNNSNPFVNAMSMSLWPESPHTLGTTFSSNLIHSHANTSSVHSENSLIPIPSITYPLNMSSPLLHEVEEEPDPPAVTPLPPSTPPPASPPPPPLPPTAEDPAVNPPKIEEKDSPDKLPEKFVSRAKKVLRNMALTKSLQQENGGATTSTSNVFALSMNRKRKNSAGRQDKASQTDNVCLCSDVTLKRIDNFLDKFELFMQEGANAQASKLQPVAKNQAGGAKLFLSALQGVKENHRRGGGGGDLKSDKMKTALGHPDGVENSLHEKNRRRSRSHSRGQRRSLDRHRQSSSPQGKRRRSKSERDSESRRRKSDRKSKKRSRRCNSYSSRSSSSSDEDSDSDSCNHSTDRASSRRKSHKKRKKDKHTKARKKSHREVSRTPSDEGKRRKHKEKEKHRKKKDERRSRRDVPRNSDRSSNGVNEAANSGNKLSFNSMCDEDPQEEETNTLDSKVNGSEVSIKINGKKKIAPIWVADSSDDEKSSKKSASPKNMSKSPVLVEEDKSSKLKKSSPSTAPSLEENVPKNSPSGKKDGVESTKSLSPVDDDKRKAKLQESSSDTSDVEERMLNSRLPKALRINVKNSLKHLAKSEEKMRESPPLVEKDNNGERSLSPDCAKIRKLLNTKKTASTSPEKGKAASDSGEWSSPEKPRNGTSEIATESNNSDAAETNNKCNSSSSSENKEDHQPERKAEAVVVQQSVERPDISKWERNDELLPAAYRRDEERKDRRTASVTSRSRSRSRSVSRRHSRSRSDSRSHSRKRDPSITRSVSRRSASRRRSRSYSRSSYSRSRSRSRGSRRYSSRSRSRSRSRSHSRSRSRSIPRRVGSPSFLDKRRITSARKRPVPYNRKRYYSYSSDSSVGNDR